MCLCVYESLVVEITEPSAEYLKYLSNTEKNGDHSEGVHGAEEDGLFKVFGHHALSHVKGLFQSTGITHVQGVDLQKKDKHNLNCAVLKCICVFNKRHREIFFLGNILSLITE